MRLDHLASGLPLFEPGLHYGPIGGLTTAAFVNNNEIRAVPFYLGESQSFDRIALEVTGAGEAGALIRLGIYVNKPGGAIPQALLLDAGTINGASATLQAVTIAQSVGPGLVWLAAQVEAAPTTRPTVRTIINSHSQPGVGTTTGAAANIGGYGATGVTPGSLPATFPAITVYGIGPFITLRAA